VRQTGNPRDALAFLERRLRVERLVAHLVRWSYAGLCVAMIFVFPPMVAGHRSRDVEMAFAFTATAVLFAVTFSAPWWVARRNRRHVEEIARWRRWMDEQQI
jgi:predicted Co/Zn/Cd cation transporter (cation efflux family)